MWMMTFLAWRMSLLFANEHNTWGLAIFLGGTMTAVNTFLVHYTPPKIAYTGVGMVLMGFVSLHAHQLHGMIEALSLRPPLRLRYCMWLCTNYRLWAMRFIYFLKACTRGAW
ncbi:MAG: hypothetical protein WAO12_01305 [Venatoribacter sp.]